MAALSRADMALALCDKRKIDPFIHHENRDAYAIVPGDERYASWSPLLSSKLFADLLIQWMDEDHHLTVPKAAIEQVVATLSVRAIRAHERAQAHLHKRFDAVGIGIFFEDLSAELPGVGRHSLFHAIKDVEWGKPRLQLDIGTKDGKPYVLRVDLRPNEGVYIAPGGPLR